MYIASIANGANPSVLDTRLSKRNLQNVFTDNNILESIERVQDITTLPHLRLFKNIAQPKHIFTTPRTQAHHITANISDIFMRIKHT